MSRRDTIIMAVLINAGLLVILFATAITHEDNPSILAASDDRQLERPNLLPLQELAPVQPMPLREESVVTFSQEMPHSPLTFSEPAHLPTRIEPLVPSVAPIAPYSSDMESAAVSAPVPRAKSTEVVVKKGDSLDKIARANGTTVEALQSANRLQTTKLQIGQVLKVPLKDGVSAGKRIVAGAESHHASERFYTIQSGDNPWAISMKLHIPLDELLKMNNMTEEGARKLRPGDKIRIQ